MITTGIEPVIKEFKSFALPFCEVTFIYTINLQPHYTLSRKYCQVVFKYFFIFFIGGAGMIRTFIKGVKVLCTNHYTTALFMDHKTRIELAPSVWKTEILTIILLMDMVVKAGHCTYKVLRHQFYRLTRYYLRSTSRLLALTEGFEPPRLLHPSVFKTDTSTTLSSQHLWRGR